MRFISIFAENKTNNMKNIIKYLFIVLIVIITSCEKDPNSTDTIFYGTVVDSKTNQPIQGATISYYWSSYDLMPSASEYVTKTDKEGKYNFRLRVPYYNIDGYQFTFTVNYPGYLGSYIWYTPGLINQNNIILIKNAYLKIHIKNTSPYNVHDHFSLYWTDYDNTDEGYDGYGTNIDTTITRVVAPNNNCEIKWEVLKNNSFNQYNENIYISSSDTNYYTIFY